MKRSLTATTLLLLVGIAAIGCGRDDGSVSVEPAVIDKPVPEAAEVDLAVLRYDTGDVQNWPDYQLPLEHSFDSPKPPPEIIGPFSADDIPAEE